MKTNKFFTIIILLFGFVLIAQTGKTQTQMPIFQRLFGSAGLGNDVKQTPDGGYVITGYVNDEVCLIKTDADGIKLWSKTYGGTGIDVGYSIELTSDGGYIIAGETSSFPTLIYFEDVYVIKTDASGNLEWSRTFSSDRDDYSYSVKQTSDGGYVILGYTEGFGSIFADIWIIKLNSNGNLQWSKMYDGGDTDYGLSIQQTNDHGFIITGWHGGYIGAGNYDLCLIKTDSLGNLVWSKLYGGPLADGGYSVLQTQDGGFIACGYTESFVNTQYDDNFYVVKTDANGNLEWSKTIGNGNWERSYSMSQTSDGGYAIFGMSGDSTDWDDDACLVKIDANGSILWNKLIGLSTTNGDYFYSGMQTSDGGFIATGFSQSKLYLVKAEWSGTSGCDEENAGMISSTPATVVNNVVLQTVDVTDSVVVNTPATIVGSATPTQQICYSIITSVTEENIGENQISLFPNPTIGNLIITNAQGFTFNLYDLSSRLIFSKKIDKQEEIINLNVSSGIYLYDLNIKKGKIVVSN
ncbi:MAG: T9SS type A sorting domain-containing protein [Candidatus Paceibacterota bacterium]|jgi:hypothetical protein